MIEIALAVVGILLGFGEFYIWHNGLLWHDSPKTRPAQLSSELAV
jgi:hypothetical protein